MMEVVVTTGATRHAKLHLNHHHQQTNIQLIQARCPSSHLAIIIIKSRYEVISEIINGTTFIILSDFQPTFKFQKSHYGNKK